jgi:hypothetical protein
VVNAGGAWELAKRAWDPAKRLSRLRHSTIVVARGSSTIALQSMCVRAKGRRHRELAGPRLRGHPVLSSARRFVSVLGTITANQDRHRSRPRIREILLRVQAEAAHDVLKSRRSWEKLGHGVWKVRHASCAFSCHGDRGGSHAGSLRLPPAATRLRAPVDRPVALVIASGASTNSATGAGISPARPSFPHAPPPVPSDLSPSGVRTFVEIGPTLDYIRCRSARGIAGTSGSGT